MSGAGPLLGKRVLITRPAHQAEEFAQALRDAGAEPVLAPTIAIVPPDDAAALRGSLTRAHSYEWIVFTSANGVEGVFAACATGERDAVATALAAARVAAIGPKTAHALEARGVRVDLVPDEFAGEHVASALLARTRARSRVLLYRAQDGRETIPDALRGGARIVDVVAAYATRPVIDASIAEKARRADVVTFASASAVDGFVRNVPDAAALLVARTVAAIGPVTADAARAAGIRVDAVASRFTAEGLLHALVASAAI